MAPPSTYMAPRPGQPGPSDPIAGSKQIQSTPTLPWKSTSTVVTAPRPASSLNKAPPPPLTIAVPQERPKSKVTSSAAPAKRLAEPPSSPRKKSKTNFLTRCSVCQQVPLHLLKDCPKVKEGRSSIQKVIEDDNKGLLQLDSGTRIALLDLLKKQKPTVQNASGSSSSSGPQRPSGPTKPRKSDGSSKNDAIEID